ncbi:hypothetical protein BKA67DRAFT_532643 [Truncatella angustata]|uniref:Uncharacterized protein n=1 Tax=Truncatella angustata TaxID=152316 RepID=A0A9P8US27_9PEZI|nr:uncharacterized protein BKA67DRAFT_532643 [Truncatella angustata]KAH6657432.1 hypothetical protein BKA67DRAFT_532643 [Truncatella angustata]
MHPSVLLPLLAFATSAQAILPVIGACIAALGASTAVAPGAVVGYWALVRLDPLQLGVLLGIIAATIQATIGNVAAGNAFGILQSADIGGTGAVIVQTAGAVVGAVGVGLSLMVDESN